MVVLDIGNALVAVADEVAAGVVGCKSYVSLSPDLILKWIRDNNVRLGFGATGLVEDLQRQVLDLKAGKLDATLFND